MGPTLLYLIKVSVSGAVLLLIRRRVLRGGAQTLPRDRRLQFGQTDLGTSWQDSRTALAFLS